jgi:signal transduction histidine kinase
MSKIEEAKAAIAELLENARTGNIIPIRLPGQVEKIQTLLLEAEEEHKGEIQDLKNLPGGDTGELIIDTAEFFKTAIHDLKNPLASIKGYGDMLINPAMGAESLNDMQKQFLEVIRTNTKRMEVLLADVSVVNKLKAGILRVNDKMDMFKNIAMVLERDAKPMAEELNRQLEFDIPQGLPILNIDGDHLAMALLKLIENGLKYSPEGDGKVTVSARGEDGNLIITVADNGIGMKADELAQLGTMFFRADHDLVRSYKGSGLGIPIAYGLIEKINGTISASSTPDEGTTFEITVPGMS